MKKFFAFLLAVSVALGTVTAAFAANPKLTKQIAAIDDWDVGEREPGYAVWLPLTADLFEDATDDLTMDDIKKSKITVRTTSKSGAKAIGPVEIKADSDKIANVVVTLQEPFVSTEALDFDVTLQLSIDGKRQNFETYVTGTLRNKEISVSQDWEQLDLSNGEVAACTGNIRKIEIDVGNGVYITTKLSSGKKYYGVATIGPDDSDDEILDKYPDIDAVYRLTTIGLNSSGSTVSLETGDSGFVYDSDLAYLGTTDEALPYSDKYYVALKKLELELNKISTDSNGEADDGEDADEPEDDTGEPIDGDQENQGGTDPNPDTGADPFLGAAIVLGLISLTVVGVLTAKKKAR